MFNHGTISAMLFILVGVVYERAHHRDIDGFGGLASQMPVYTGITALAFFAGLGLPGFSGFVSEAMCFIGAFPVFRTIVILSTIGILLNAAYFLWAFQRVFLESLMRNIKIWKKSMAWSFHRNTASRYYFILWNIPWSLS